MEVKGTAVKSIREFVEKQYNERFFEWIQSLPAPSQEIFNDNINVAQWYPVKWAAVEPTKLIGEMFFNGNAADAAFESGRFSAQHALTGIYKAFVMISSPSFIIDRASRIMTSYYQPSNIVVVEKKPKLCVVHITQLPDVNPIIEMRIAGWISKAFEITGCKDVQVLTPLSMSRQDSYTEIRILWS